MVSTASTLIAGSARAPANRETPTASIIVLARHSQGRLDRCLLSLARLSDQIPKEVLVLLNGADAGVRSLIDRCRPEASTTLTLFESPMNLGFAAGCNVLAGAAAGQYLIFLNDDTEVEEGWLRGLVEVAESDQTVGAVGSCVLFPDGSVQEAGSIVWQDGSIMSLGRGVPPDSASISYVRQVDYCSACSLLVPRCAWEAVGGFCEDYFPAYYEDVDLCFSLRAMGYRVVYAPRSRLMHEGGSSTEPRFRRFMNSLHRQRFRQRWEQALAALEPPDPTSPAAVRRAAFRARGCPRRLLMVCDPVQLPGDPQWDRTSNAAISLANAAYSVTVWTSNAEPLTRRELSLNGIELLAGDLARHLQEPDVLYDVVLVSTPHAFERCEAVIRKSQPHSVLIYDAGDVHHRQLQGQAGRGRGEHAGLAKAAVEMHTLEATLRARADFITCASLEAKAFFNATNGAAPVTIVSAAGRAAAGAAQPPSASSREANGGWSDALRAAQLTRSHKMHT